MSLQLILGNAGSGKSHYIYDRLAAYAASDSHRRCILIVPEQFTVSAEKELVMRLRGHAMMNISVLSFDRLAYQVFDELGTPLDDVIDDTGRSLLIRRVAEEHMGELTVLSGRLKKPGYIDEVRSLIAELEQYGIGPDELEQMADKASMGESFRSKAHDLALLYRGFRAALEGRFITAEDRLIRLSEVIVQSQSVRDSVLAFDGFTGFTPLQNELLKRLIPMACEVLVTVTTDTRLPYLSDSGEQDLFHMSHRMIRLLLDAARHTQILEPVILPEGDAPGRFVPGGMLHHLEQNLYRTYPRRYDPNSNPAGDSIQIGRCASYVDELSYAASVIREAVRTKGLRYRDCALICANLEDYSNYVQEVFLEYDVPVYLDVNTDIVFHPLTELIRSALSMITDDFSEESVIHHIRSGLSVLDEKEADILSTYIHSKGIRGVRSYQRAFRAVPKIYHRYKNAAGEDPLAEEREAYMEEVNRIRVKFMENWQPLWDAVGRGKHTVREYSTALYLFLVSCHVEERLSARANAWEQANEEILADRDRRIFGIVMDLLDEMVSLLGDETVSMDEYAQILETGLSSIRFGTIPPAMDSVVVGDMERTRLEGIRLLFVIGASDASIPGPMSHGGIISQIEREKLLDASYELAPTDRERAFMQRFYIYLALTKPSDSLYITYARLDPDGRSLRQSYLITSLLEIFPALHVQNLEELPAMAHMITPLSARRYLTSFVRSYAAGEIRMTDQAETIPALLHLMQEDGSGRTELKKLEDAAFYRHPNERISKAIARTMQSDTIGGSVSRLEDYAACPYAYFLKYALRLTENEEPGIRTVDRGIIYHEVLERYSKELIDAHIDWHEVSRQDCGRYLDLALAQTMERMTQESEVLTEDAKMAHELDRMEHTLQRTVWILTRQIRSGSFEPAAFELDLADMGPLRSMQFSLPDSSRMFMRGKIDRIDLCQSADQVYVRIIDYKSGNTSLDLKRMYYGLQIQLVLYMTAALEGMSRRFSGRIIRPAAMCYYNISDPLIKTSADTDDASIEDSIIEELKLKGISSSDDHILAAQDASLMPDADGGYSSARSSVIKASRKKDGSLDSRSQVCTEESFGIMGEYVHDMIRSTGERIHEGQFEAAPYKMGDETACRVCPFRAVCGFDARLRGFAYRNLPAIEGNVIERMAEDTAAGRGSNGMMVGRLIDEQV